MAKSQILAAIIHITRRAARRKCSVVTAILLTFFLFPLFLYFLLGYAIANDPRLVPHAIRNAQNVLFITAHPDDGPLFFGPSILQAWGKGNVNRYVLVLSSEGMHLVIIVPHLTKKGEKVNLTSTNEKINRKLRRPCRQTTTRNKSLMR